jgi:hypothetical protein
LLTESTTKGVRHGGSLAVFLALAVVYLLPGPDMILLLQTGARQGRGAALATAVGLAIARAVTWHWRHWVWRRCSRRRPGPSTWCAWPARVPAVDRHSVPAQHLLPNLNGARAGKPQWREAIQRGADQPAQPKALLFCSVLLPQFIVTPARC